MATVICFFSSSLSRWVLRSDLCDQHGEYMQPIAATHKRPCIIKSATEHQESAQVLGLPISWIPSWSCTGFGSRDQLGHRLKFQQELHVSSDLMGQKIYLPTVVTSLHPLVSPLASSRRQSGYAAIFVPGI
ncbi:Hypothetical predicted protein [Pelobates cultripes]|uniref:Uncharacterized protein n=1 Tax=Pelobates cultripes TaxID=61616 RepID=A0AAD1SGH0_PELCU|nr:Hypothetical predicted protein [Pelobates cultripes]